MLQDGQGEPVDPACGGVPLKGGGARGSDVVGRASVWVGCDSGPELGDLYGQPNWGPEVRQRRASGPPRPPPIVRLLASAACCRTDTLHGAPGAGGGHRRPARLASAQVFNSQQARDDRVRSSEFAGEPSGHSGLASGGDWDKKENEASRQECVASAPISSLWLLLPCICSAR